MYIFDDTVLMVTSGIRVEFYKRKACDFTGVLNWKVYTTVELRGFLYYMPGNVRIQITTNEKIFFYIIDLETYMPKLDNVMNNYMRCSQMMFGPRVNYCLTFMTNQVGFDIYRRKYQHSFKAPIIYDNYDKSCCIELRGTKQVLLSKKDRVDIFESDLYKFEDEIRLELQKSDSREPVEILSMQVSNNEDLLAIVTGKVLI